MIVELGGMKRDFRVKKSQLFCNCQIPFRYLFFAPCKGEVSASTLLVTTSSYILPFDTKDYGVVNARFQVITPTYLDPEIWVPVACFRVGFTIKHILLRSTAALIFSTFPSMSPHAQSKS